MTSWRWRPRAAVVGCAWFVVASTLTTMLISVRDLRQSSGDELYTHDGFAYKLVERKPQSSAVDYSSSDDVIGELSKTNESNGDLELNVTSSSDRKSPTSESHDSGYVEDKIFWSQQVESLVPTGLTDEQWSQFVQSVSHQAVANVEAAKWNKCGRPKNKYVKLEDGSVMCARYRHPINTLLQGELLTFYLSRLLEMDNVPATVLSRIENGTLPWREYNLTQTGWQQGHILTLTQWIHHLSHTRSRAHVPAVLLSAYNSGQPLSVVNNATSEQLQALIQWTDLIVFDYITGHYDRVASMLDGALQEANPDIMQQSVRNLRCQWPTGKLWLIDNESGLLDAYMLLYGPNAGSTGSQFHEFHQRLLRSTCLFRRQTVKKIIWLSKLSSPSNLLETVATRSDPLYHILNNRSTDELEIFRKFFHVRLDEVVQWIQKCQK